MLSNDDFYVSTRGRESAIYYKYIGFLCYLFFYNINTNELIFISRLLDM